MKQFLIAVVAVFFLWSVIGIVLHGVVLCDMYQKTAQLWRPVPEMKRGLMNIVTLVSVLLFVTIYASFVSRKSASRGIAYGLLFGLAWGMSMGFGSYSVMPIPSGMAFAWFLGSVIEMTLGGLLVGLIIKE